MDHRMLMDHRMVMVLVMIAKSKWNFENLFKILLRTYSYSFRSIICWWCSFWFLLSLKSWSSILKPDLIMMRWYLNSSDWEKFLLKFFHDEHQACLPEHQQWLPQDNDYFEMLLQVFVTNFIEKKKIFQIMISNNSFLLVEECIEFVCVLHKANVVWLQLKKHYPKFANQSLKQNQRE